MFIKHVLGVGEKHRGLYGDTEAFYATVEQQGRLTLHLYMLLWIKGASDRGGFKHWGLKCQEGRGMD